MERNLLASALASTVVDTTKLFLVVKEARKRQISALYAWGEEGRDRVVETTCLAAIASSVLAKLQVHSGRQAHFSRRARAFSALLGVFVPLWRVVIVAAVCVAGKRAILSSRPLPFERSSRLVPH